MGLSLATLAGHRVLDATVNVPAWGIWYADATIEGEVALSGAVDLVIADTTFKGTVLFGGPSKGRSKFRIVGGAGGWNKIAPKKSYANDAGVSLATVVTDAANFAGETLDSSAFSSQTRLGPSWVVPGNEPATQVLQLVAPQTWYVDVDGKTKLGRRAAKTFSDTSPRVEPLDVARGTVTLAPTSIAALVPGAVVDGLEAVDVQHEISKTGLRTTVWGKQGGTTSRRLAAYEAILEQLDPNRKFRAKWEYRVVTIEGHRLNLQPVLVSTGMPDLRRVYVRPGAAGYDAKPALGSRVVVGFLNEDPARPYVDSFEDPDGEGFEPDSISLYADDMVAGEHVATVEGVTLLIYNVLSALFLQNSSLATTTAAAKSLKTVINLALTACAVPAPPTEILQDALDNVQQNVPDPTNSLLGLGQAIQTVGGFTFPSFEAKQPNASGKFPGLGCKAIKAG